MNNRIGSLISMIPRPRQPTKIFIISAFNAMAIICCAAIILSLSSNPTVADDTPARALTAGERGLDAVQGRRDMRHYSEDVAIKGIGVFINLQANAPATDDQIGKWVQKQFAGVNVPVDYRFNQSRGTSTDLTFYVRGVHYVHNIDDVPTKLREVYDRYQGAWLPETSSPVGSTAPTPRK